MKKTRVKIASAPVSITYNKPICFIGSCFSDSMQRKCADSGFQVYSNPFGVIFNPISIAAILERSINATSFEDTIFKQQDVYLSWMANRTLFGYNKSSFLSTLTQEANNFKQALTKADTLFITLGTAWVYKHIERNDIVANCHKEPNATFDKILITADEIINYYHSLFKKLEVAFPSLKIVFTVSPVRHAKDGLVENNQSKAHLITAVHHLVATFEKVHYFPSYEIVMDELRDYAFYKGDGLHPNEFAIDYIWSRFKSVYLTDEVEHVVDAFERLNIQANHQPIHKESAAAIQFKQQLKERMTAFKQQHPYLILTEAMKAYL